MRFPVSIILASTLLYGTAQAQNDKVGRGPAPDWVVPSELMPVPADASGLSFMRRQDTQVHLDKDGQVLYSGYRIKILHPNALQLGNLSLQWNPAAGAPTVHAINVYRGDTVVDVLKKSSFEILRREDQLEAAKLDGILTAVFRVADLRVGDELEFALTTRISDPTLGEDDAGLLVLAPNPSPGRIHFGLSWIDGQQPKIKMTTDMAAIAEKSERAVNFRLDNPSVLSPIKDAPARYQWRRIVEYSDFPDWASLSRRFAPLYTKAATLPDNSPLKLEAARIATAHANPLDRASAALNLVQQDVRYIYVGFNGGNLTPAAATDTWQRRYGDCKGKTALLMGLLAELGIESEAVLANNAGNDDGLDERLPTMQMFDHVLLRARIDGVLYYMDGTLPPVAPPAPSPVFPYRWILPLSAKGNSLERLEWRAPKRPNKITLHEIDARAGFDQPARITNTVIVRGLEGLQQYISLSGLAKGELLTSIRQGQDTDYWLTIDEAKWRYDQKAQASVLTIVGTSTVEWEGEINEAKSLVLPGGGFSPPAKLVRPTGQNQDLPYYQESEFSCDATTVRLPSATQAKQWSFNSEFDTQIFSSNYYRAFGISDSSIRMVRGFRVEKQEIDAAEARRDNGRIASFDKSMAVISYDPTTKNLLAQSGKKVPATYDTDWAADIVPCLSAKALE